MTLRCRTVPVDLRNLITVSNFCGLDLQAEEIGNVPTAFKMFIFVSRCSGSSDLARIGGSASKPALPGNQAFNSCC